MAILEFVCLANSRKHGGRCVAGITRAGTWARPVSSEPDGRLSSRDCTFGDGSEPALLDLIRLEATPCPKPHQPENWRISGARWHRLGRLGSQEARPWLHRVAIPGPYLFGNPIDKVSYANLVEHPIQSSLCVVEPAELSWRIRTKQNGNRQVRAIFRLAGTLYDLSVSDSSWEARLANLHLGVYSSQRVGILASQDTFLTVSLAEPFDDGDCYKLIAAVIVL